MRRRIALLISVLMISLSLCVPTLAESDVPSIDDALFADAKQALVYFDSGDFDSAASLLEFADADELSKFVSGNFSTIGSGVQTTVSVAYWTGNAWELAVPLQEPVADDVEALILLTEDGTSFTGYAYATWGQVSKEYASCTYVVWNEEYVPSDPYVVE